MPKFEDDSKPRRRVIGADQPPSQEITVFTAVLKVLGRANEGENQPGVKDKAVKRWLKLLSRNRRNPQTPKE